ncbi:hypothetical protein [Rhodomicrobium lacus]|uniref:hypothetical protein n=1 Tax=Rhodomicrobium lacus TaxID=2498452 RepID=UPI000F8E2AD5|nr:hypothetical protein [Rhodomicrobium lacus]
MRTAFMLVLAMFCGLTPSLACTGKIDALSARRTLVYNPFSALDGHQQLSIQVQNTGTESCAYRLWIPDRYLPLQFGNIDFTISGQRAPSAADSSGLTIQTPIVAPGQSIKLPLRLSVARGQQSLAGKLTKKIGFALAAEQARTTLLDQTEVDIHCVVPPVFEINVAGSGLRATLEIDDLKLRSKAVVLQMRSTQNHRLEIQAENGALIREGSPPGDSTSIPYVVTIDGQSSQLKKGAIWRVNGPAGESSRRLNVTIGDTADKLAGLYKDVITVHIASDL